MPRQDVPRPRGLLEPFGETPEKLSSPGPSELFVDGPEGLEVEQQEGGLLPAVAPLEVLEEGPAVVQSRQVVLDGERGLILAAHSHGGAPFYSKSGPEGQFLEGRSAKV